MLPLPGCSPQDPSSQTSDTFTDAFTPTSRCHMRTHIRVQRMFLARLTSGTRDTLTMLRVINMPRGRSCPAVCVDLNVRRSYGKQAFVYIVHVTVI